MKLEWEIDEYGGCTFWTADLGNDTNFEIDWMSWGFELFYQARRFESHKLGTYKSGRAARVAAAWMLRNRKPPYTKKAQT